MFDLDGTLIDSVPDLADAVETMLLKLGRPPAGIENVRLWIGNGAPMLVRRALAGNMDGSGVDDVEAEHALEIFMEAYDGGHAHTTVYPGVRESLKWLQKQGVEMALITNKPERFVAPLLDELKLGRFFAGSSVATPCHRKTRPGCSAVRDENGGRHPGPVDVYRRFTQ